MAEYTSGPYVITPDSTCELLAAILESIVYAIYFEKHGKCSCGCEIKECDYCAHECIYRNGITDL